MPAGSFAAYTKNDDDSGGLRNAWDSTHVEWRARRRRRTGSQRYDFDISHWNGTVAPAANMKVDLVVNDGGLATMTPVNDADLAKESLAAVTGEGGRYARAIFADVGKDVAIGYGLFFVIASCS